MRGFFIFPLIFIFLSCATVSPVTSDRETAVVFETAGLAAPQWQKLAVGIDYLHGRIITPHLEFWALRIEIASPSLRIVVKSGKTSAKVSSFVRDNSLIAGINAVPFDISSSKEGQPIQNVGIVVSGGELIAPANPHYDALVFSKPHPVADSMALIVSQNSIYSTENIENAVGGFHQILANGEPARRTLDNEARHPRSAAGISANGEYLYLLVIDGSRSGSIGATENETAQLLRSLGSADGINFDGGGSSALALRYPDGKVRVVNNPAHNGIPGTERAVAGCLGIAINP